MGERKGSSSSSFAAFGPYQSPQPSAREWRALGCVLDSGLAKVPADQQAASGRRRRGAGNARGRSRRTRSTEIQLLAHPLGQPPGEIETSN
jgi:hypothetical protein